MYFWQTRATNKFIRLYFIFPRLEYTIQNVLNATCYRSPSLDPWIIQGWKIHTSNYFVAMLNMNFTHSLPNPSRFKDKTPCSFDDFLQFFYSSIKSKGDYSWANNSKSPAKNWQQSELNKTWWEIHPGFEWPLKLDEWNFVFKSSTVLQLRNIEYK